MQQMRRWSAHAIGAMRKNDDFVVEGELLNVECFRGNDWPSDTNSRGGRFLWQGC